MASIIDGGNLNLLSKQIIHSLDAIVSLITIPPETSILLQYRIYNIYSNKNIC